MTPINKLITYTILIIFVPRGVGFSTELSLWVFLAIIYLFPSLIDYLVNAKLKLDLSNSLFLALFILLILGSIITGAGNTGLKLVFPQFFYFFLPFFAGKYFVKSKSDLFKFCYMLIVASIFISLIAILEFILKKSFFSYFDFLMSSSKNVWENSQEITYKGSMIRPIASFGQGIYLGIFLGLTILISSFLTFILKINFFVCRKRIVLLQIFLSIIGIFISQSRTTMLAIPIVAALYIIINIKRMKIASTFFLTLFLIFSLSVLYILFNNYLDDYLYENISGRDSMINATTRIDIVTLGYYLVVNDLTVWGDKNFQVIRFLADKDVLNGFLYKFLNHGLAYGIVYICFWLAVIRGAFKLDQYLNLDYLLTLIIIYFFIVTNITTLYFQNEIIFFIVSGLAVNPYLRISQSQNPYEFS